MQILTFVTVTLMVLTLITYARLQHFLDFQVMNAHYAPYMESTQRHGFNAAQEHNYDADKMSKGPKKDQVTDATAKVSLNILLNKSERDKSNNNDLLKQQIAILKSLMVNLYKGHSFFKPVEDNLHLLDQFFDALMNTADSQKVITRMSDLATFRLGNETLQSILYHSLQGTAEPEKVQEEKKKEDTLSVKEAEEPTTKPDDEVAPSQKGYVSLFDFITLAKGPKIRMFLAPKEILEAIYGKDSSIVDKMLEMRHQLLLAINNEKMEPDMANQKFNNTFRDSTPAWLSMDQILDFTIKKAKDSTPKPQSANQGKAGKAAN
jgi:hypothetical protein